MEEQNQNQTLEFFNIMDQIEGSHNGSINRFTELANSAFSEAVRRVAQTGKKGKLVLTFSIENVGERIEITGDINSKLPEPTQKGKLFYYNSRGELTNEDPKQPSLPTQLRPLARVSNS